MGKTFIPTVSQRKEKRRNNHTHRIAIIDQETFNKKYKDRIRFVSRNPKYIFLTVREDTKDTSFGVYLKKFVVPSKLHEPIEKAFPEGCKISLYQPYRLTHTVGVRLTKPMKWGVFQHRIVKALEELI